MINVGKMINFVNELKQTQSPNLCLSPTYTHSALRDVPLSHANLKTDWKGHENSNLGTVLGCHGHRDHFREYKGSYCTAG